jgi:tetratricopeptide (TPR) repeat protein
MFERFGTAEEPLTAYTLAWTCVLATQAVADPTRPVQLAERALAKDANDPAYHDTLGAALYRAGRFPEAVRQLGEASTLKPNPKTSPRYAWLFLAMAHHRQGNTDEARRWLDKAVHGLDSELAETPWNRRLTLQLLRREAEELVEDKKKEDRK